MLDVLNISAENLNVISGFKGNRVGTGENKLLLLTLIKALTDHENSVDVEEISCIMLSYEKN